MQLNIKLKVQFTEFGGRQSTEMEKHVGSLKSPFAMPGIQIYYLQLKEEKTKDLWIAFKMKKKSTEKACGAYENKLIFPHFSQEKDYKQ